MSSHHFVIDGQEPALIIANGEMCSIPLLTQLLEWCPLVVALDGAYSRLQQLQIKPDVVIGDFDSLHKTPSDPDVTFIKIEDQETTDLEKAINYLQEKDTTYINIVWATGKRLDHTLNNIHTLFAYPEVKLVLYDDYSKAFLLPKTFKKRYQRGQKISLFPKGEVVAITTENLVYNLKEETLSIGNRSGSSNAAKEDGEVTIHHTGGQLILIESND